MIDYEIEALATAVGPGQHTGLQCPRCRATDRAFSLLVDPPSIKAICHRASCNYRYSNTAARWESIGAEVRPTRARPYTGELHTLDNADLLWFAERFRLPINALDAIRKSDDRYFLPIYSPEGSRRGWVSRRPWEGSPLNRSGSGDLSPKSLTYMDNDEPVQHWTGWSKRNPLVIVEDQISALRVSYDTALPCVAILGTGVNEEKVAELQRYAKRVLIALDADATGQAFAIARKWGQAFTACRVVILTKDIKDETTATVQKIFQNFAPI